MQPDATVWIVDDDPSIRNSLRWLIESIGLTVRTCESAEEYLRVYVDSPGCLVTDLRMPGMSGLELQEELAARGRVVPTIFLTAHGEVPIAVYPGMTICQIFFHQMSSAASVPEKSMFVAHGRPVLGALQPDNIARLLRG